MKAQIREEILSKRNSLAKKEVFERSEKIKNNLFNLQEYKKAKNVMFFVSFGNEVHTHEMIKQALKDKIVIAPKVLNHDIEPSVIMSLDNLVPTGKFGILEPIDLMKIAYKNIDLILVAGIAFDNEGYRLGYGLGFYDIFLAKLPKAIKIGLAFDFQVVDKVPREEHDVPVDTIVTDKRVIECKKI